MSTQNIKYINGYIESDEVEQAIEAIDSSGSESILQLSILITYFFNQRPNNFIMNF